jgi:arsenite methyltransferase
MQLLQSLDKLELENRVKSMYREVAETPTNNFHFEMGRSLAERLGYPVNLLDRIPPPAVDSFAGVGYFFNLIAIPKGSKIVDLGSGSGTDAFIAALLTGPNGSVTGIDMTSDQLVKAKRLRDQYGFRNVQFLKGYIEDVPLPGYSADVIISNGVVNLSADKRGVFEEAARMLRPGGQLVLSDIVSEETLPETITCNAALWASCIGGAIPLEEYIDLIEQAGFKLVTTTINPRYSFLSDSARSATIKYGIRSVSLVAVKK